MLTAPPHNRPAPGDLTDPTPYSVTVYGASDDLVGVDGGLREEFTPHSTRDAGALVFNDGTVLHIGYTRDGLWKIQVVHQGAAALRWDVRAEDPDGDDYSDRVSLLSTAPMEWVVWVDGARVAPDDETPTIDFCAARLNTR